MKQIKGIWFPENDTHFQKHVFNNGDYQQEQFQAAMKHIREPKLFFDVGAHVGLWSLMAIRAGFKEVRAFEPNHITFKCLVSNISNFSHVTIHNYGVAERNDIMQLIFEDKNNSGAIRVVRANQSAENNALMCEVRNINNDNIGSSVYKLSIKPNETLVKIDTEGSELDCVKGMDKIIQSLQPVVIVEQRKNTDAVKYLKDMGMVQVDQVLKDYILIYPINSTLSQSTMDSINTWQK